MKTTLLIISLTILFSCQLEMQQADATNIACFDNGCINYEKRTIDGMEYGIFRERIYYGITIHVVNLTKDKLEIELLRKQLRE